MKSGCIFLFLKNITRLSKNTLKQKMNDWNPDKYIKAWNYASVVHKGQNVPGTDISYLNHIGLVTMEAVNAFSHSKHINAPDLLVQCALLHDTIEDTACTYDDICEHFGLDVAKGVLALSKNTELASKEAQMQDSLQRIKQQPLEVWMVKLADRISNLQTPPHYWHKEKIAYYRVEAQLILSELGEANSYLADRLATKIEAYQQYL